MIIYGIVTRSGVIIGEYGITTDELSQEVLAIIQRNTSSGTRLVPMDGKTCAVMNKSINGEIISFASVIESSDERDISFNFLDSLANFYEKEQSNPKMKTEMNAFLSKQTKILMEKANLYPSPKEKLHRLNDSMQKTTDIAKGSISKP